MFLLNLLLFIFLVTESAGQPPVGTCYCIANAEAANVRDSPCGNVIKSHQPGACFKATGENLVCDLGGNTYNYYELDYNGQGAPGWVANLYLEEVDAEKCNGMGVTCSESGFVSRGDWGARDPVQTTPIDTPFSGVFIHHSFGLNCYTEEECIPLVQEIQDLHMDTNGWDDIGFNFLVGEDGNIYEGRGWDAQGAHALDHNAWTYGICILGDFSTTPPNGDGLTALKSAMQCGVDQGKLTPGHEVFGHRDGVCTDCPGDLLYQEIQRWPYYSTRDIPEYCPVQ